MRDGAAGGSWGHAAGQHARQHPSAPSQARRVVLAVAVQAGAWVMAAQPAVAADALGRALNDLDS
jgi:hypothetical protein